MKVPNRIVSSKDCSRINTGENYELQYWSQKFGVTPDALKAIIVRVGDSVKAVEREVNAICVTTPDMAGQD